MVNTQRYERSKTWKKEFEEALERVKTDETIGSHFRNALINSYQSQIEILDEEILLYERGENDS